MAKVSLRSYNREIEGFIDQSRLDEAIAHCRYILQTYPKHLETYRLLGKAYLEAKRYEEAVDIFTRVLASVPSDFVSHVGMSIIRDEQSRLDEAIAHMERAFESQPSNAAIQNELRRLFGRRDGSQPAKIRMNRSALAHMYLQGELYPQAISEIKAVLAADSHREDMRALLARAYYHAGQKADASDSCSQLLENNAYSFDANRIMTELMQGTDSAASGDIYRNRVIEMDPYAAHSPASVFRSNEVSDVAISLEHLDYRGQEVEPAPEWKPAGIGVAAPDEQPEWLKRAYPSSLEEPTASEPETKVDLPEFMRAAGWTAASGAVVEPPPLEIPQEAAAAESDLVPGDMPDWLKAMAPQDQPEETPVVPTPPAVPLQPADIPDWLSDMPPQDAEAAAAPNPEAVETPAAEIPDWLSGMSPREAEAPAAPAPSAFGTPAEDIPDWLDETAPKADEIPAGPSVPAVSWMDDAAAEVVEPPAISIEPSAVAPADETPDWLRQLSAEPEAPASDIPDWLQGIEAAEPGIAPSSMDASLPDWLQPAAPKPAPPLAAIEPEPIEREFPPMITPVEPLTAPPTLESLGTSAKEQDDAMAWLESLAAKHGAKAEELVTDPNARTDKPPEWVEQARALGEIQPGSAEPIQETQPVFLEPEPERPIEPPAPFEAFEPIAAGLESSIPFEETEEPRMIVPEPEQPPAPEAAPVLEPFIPEAVPFAPDQTGVWLRGLDEKEELFEAEITETAASEAAPVEFIESVQTHEPIAALQEESEPAAPVELESVTEAAVKVSDLPDWLQDIDREEQEWPVATTETVDDDLPAWLQGEAEPAAEAEPTQPTDWRPAESLQEPDLTPEEIEAAPEPTRAYLDEMQVLRDQPQEEAEPEPVKPAAPRFEAEKEPELEPELQQEAQIEAPRYEETEPELPSAPAVSQPVQPPAPRKPPVRSERRPVAPAFQSAEPALTSARNEMNRGNIPAALDQYGRLIRRGKYLEEIIHDMREALYRYPVEITIWQTLGDAYMRENRLQEALDAYTKAEELLR